MYIQVSVLSFFLSCPALYTSMLLGQSNHHHHQPLSFVVHTFILSFFLSCPALYTSMLLWHKSTTTATTTNRFPLLYIPLSSLSSSPVQRYTLVCYQDKATTTTTTTTTTNRFPLLYIPLSSLSSSPVQRYTLVCYQGQSNHHHHHHHHHQQPLSFVVHTSILSFFLSCPALYTSMLPRTKQPPPPPPPPPPPTAFLCCTYLYPLFLPLLPCAVTDSGRDGRWLLLCCFFLRRKAHSPLKHAIHAWSFRWVRGGDGGGLFWSSSEALNRVKKGKC